MPPTPGSRWRKLAAASAVGIGISPFFLLPMLNSDIYWHLSAGRFIALHGAVPRADFLSWTMRGAPWIDFEWLSQLILHALNRLAGCGGLIAWRALLYTGAAGVVLRLIRLDGGGEEARGLAALLFGAVVFPLLSVRPDDASIFLFALLLYGLESVRLRRWRPRPRLGAAVCLLFSLWANLHLGLLYGLLLIALYAAGEAVEGRFADCGFYLLLLAAAALSSLVNPYGWKLYTVAAVHARDLAKISETLVEWKPPSFHSPAARPYWVLAALCLAAIVLQRPKTRKFSYPVLFSVVYFGCASARHVRHIGYFAVIAIPALFHAAGGAARAGGRLLRLGGGALCLLLLLNWCLVIRPLFPVVTGSRWCSVLGRRAAGFLETESPVLGGRTLFNTWGEGGYLGYRLFPAYRVFFDGRYLFHPLLLESLAAARSPELWQAFMDAHGIEIACLDRAQAPADAAGRPFYVSYMPAKTWALVFWGDHDLVFARRSAFPSSWVERHEYRLLLPGDYPRLSASAAAGRLDLSRAAQEARRHRLEDTGAAAEDAAIAEWLGRLHGLPPGAAPTKP